MKKLIASITTVGFVIALSGCATTSEPSQDRNVNTQYVHAVNETARRGGVRVIWVNPPPPRKSSEEGGQTLQFQQTISSDRDEIEIR